MIKLCYIIANIKCIYIISSHSSRVFLNTFYRIDINKENELEKMMLQLCRIACSRNMCISFSPRSRSIYLLTVSVRLNAVKEILILAAVLDQKISKYIKKLPESLLNNFFADSSLNSKLPRILFY